MSVAFPSGDQISKWDQASCEVYSHLKSQLQVKDCIASSAMEGNLHNYNVLYIMSELLHMYMFMSGLCMWGGGGGGGYLSPYL